MPYHPAMRTYVQVPDKTPAPAVVVMIHGPGLDEFIEAQVRALAAHGYVAAAADLFHRQPPAESKDLATTLARIALLRDDEIVADVDALVAQLDAMPDVLRGERAVIGFCMGGRNAYLLAGVRPATWRAAGVFYGGNIMKAWGGGPSPFERTAEIACPLIGFFGNDDGNPSPADVDAIDAELTRLTKWHDFYRYDGAGHAFLNFTNPERHRPAQAEDAWAKLLEFLDRELRPRR